MNIRYVGDSALLVEVQDFRAAQRLRESIGRQPPDGIRELLPGYDTLLVEFDPLQLDAAELLQRLPEFMQDLRSAAAAHTHEIEVRYQGEDLEDVARLTGLDRAEVIRRHSAANYTVAFLGFAPGFPYLAGLDAKLRVPRLQSPRARVPAGAVAIADEFSGVYPQATPGGWRILGHTKVVLFDAARASPALCMPGDHVRFRPVS